jgi:predicted lipoprotein with Yx(FWY)xxD motif
MNLTTATRFSGHRPHPSRTRRRVVVALAATGAAALGTAATAASPDYGPDPTTATTEAAAEGTAAEGTEAEGTAADDDTAAATETTVDPDAIVRTADSELGTILVDHEGMTLYAFLNDTEGESTCTGDCLANWPAAVVEDAELNVGNLDPELFSTVENPEAGTMLKIGDWPLYTFAGDEAPGDVNGQEVGDVWYVVSPDGTPVTLVNTRETDLGTILVDAHGFSLYGFLNDTEGESTCVDDCAAQWPPALIGDHDVSMLDPELYSTVDHPDGTMLKIGDWPLYTFTPDEAPGDINGQGVGDVWYLVAPDGTLIEEMPPATSEPGGTEPAGTEPAGTEPEGTEPEGTDTATTG